MSKRLTGDDKVKYEIRKDKNDREYGVKINLKTNKTKIVKVKDAKRRISDNKYQRTKNETLARMKFENVEGTFTQYKKAQKIVEAEYRADPKKANWSESRIKERSKRNAMLHRTGYAVRCKFVWRYWKEITYINEKTGEKVYSKDTTPIFMFWGEFRNIKSTHIHTPELDTDWQKMKKYTDRKFTKMMNEIYIDKNGIPAYEGGGCLSMYDKLSKNILHVLEWKPDGCDAHVTMNEV